MHGFIRSKNCRRSRGGRAVERRSRAPAELTKNKLDRFDGGEPAVELEDLTGHEARLLAEEESHEAGCFGRVADSPERVPVGGCLALLAGGKQGVRERGVGEGGSDAIDPDAGCELGGQGAGDSFHRTLGGCDAGVKGEPGLHGDGGEQDDGRLRALLEGGQGVPQETDGAEES